MDPLPPLVPDKSATRAFLSATARRRLDGLRFPASGFTRREFEERICDWQAREPQVEALPHRDRDYLLHLLRDQRLVSIVSGFEGGVRLFPGVIQHVRPKKAEVHAHFSAILRTGFDKMVAELAHIMFSVHMKQSNATEADHMEADRKIAAHTIAMKSAARKMVDKGITLDQMRRYLSDCYVQADYERFLMVFPWLEEGHSATKEDIWSPVAQSRSNPVTPLEKALAAIGKSTTTGITKTDLRKVVFSNNGADFQGLLDALKPFVLHRDMKAKGSKGGRPTRRYFLREFEEVIGETPEKPVNLAMIDRFHTEYDDVPEPSIYN